MKIKVSIYLGGIFLYLTLLHAQELKLNDQVPELTLQVINYGTDQVNISDFRGKVLILDFWSTTCAPCIKAIPYMDSLQRSFGDKLQILPVTTEKAERVSRFWKGNNFTKNATLPSVVNDTALTKLFPHLGNPYEVWIDQNGKVIGLTGHEYVTAKNIHNILLGKGGDWKIISNLRTNDQFNNDQPVLKQLNSDNFNETLYSALSPFIPGVRSDTKISDDTLNRTKRYTEINMPFMSFIRRVLNETSLANLLSRVVFEVRDSVLFLNINNEPRDQWRRKNSYCYESVVPYTFDLSKIFKYMKTDFERFLGLTMSVEKRKLDCWVLFRTSEDPKLLWGEERNTDYKVDEYRNSLSKEHVVTYHSVRELIEILSSTLNSTPVIDETNYGKPIRVPLLYTDKNGKKIIQSVTDIPAIQKQLKQYGLGLRKEKRLTEVLVVRQL